jgi:ADP-ribosyl-[dinitrogen reductase] hydrolase
VKSLEAALWALHNSSSFEEGCLLAANLGQDSDTTAAIYGQLAGTIYGEEGIPQKWREKLARRETIMDLADRLIQFADHT